VHGVGAWESGDMVEFSMEAFTHKNVEEWRRIVRLETEEEEGIDIVYERRAGKRIRKCGCRKVELED
jgi:hypothetical protein